MKPARRRVCAPHLRRGTGGYARRPMDDASNGKLRVALIGAGQMGRHHARVVSESDRADLTAIVDTNESAAPVAATAHVPLLRSIDDLLAGEAPDLAIVAIPTEAH